MALELGGVMLNSKIIRSALLACCLLSIPIDAMAETFRAPTETEGAVVFWPGNWNLLLQQVDVQTGTMLPIWVGLDNREDKLRYTNGSRRPASGYNFIYVAPGDYAVIGRYQPNSNGAGGSWIDVECARNAKVLHIEAQSVSIVERHDLYRQRGSGDFSAVEQIEAEVQGYVREYGSMSVHVAPIVGRFQLSPPDGRRRFYAMFITARMAAADACPSATPPVFSAN